MREHVFKRAIKVPDRGRLNIAAVSCGMGVAHPGRITALCA